MQRRLDTNHLQICKHLCEQKISLYKRPVRLSYITLTADYIQELRNNEENLNKQLKQELTDSMIKFFHASNVQQNIKNISPNHQNYYGHNTPM